MSATLQRISTRGELDTAVLGWLENRPADGDLAQLLGAAVGAAEEQLAAELRVRAMIVRVRQPIADRYLTLPCDWCEAIDVRLPAKHRALTEMDRSETAIVGAGGDPRGYAIVGDQMEVVPEQPANSPLELELAYYARPAPLLNEADSNRVLLEHPTVYLYATLLHTAMILRDDERVGKWSGLYVALRDTANLAWQRARWSGSQLNARGRRA